MKPEGVKPEGAPAGVRGVSHALFDRWARFAGSRAAVVLLFAWAFAEATVWPILADFLLVALALAVPGRLRVLLPAIVAGMALGGLVSVLTAHQFPAFAMDVVRELPLVRDVQVERARDLLDEHGAFLGFLYQPISGVPFKIWAAVAGDERLPPGVVITAFVLGRSARMLATGGVAAGAGHLLRRYVRDWFAAIAPLYVLAFAIGLAQVVGR